MLCEKQRTLPSKQRRRKAKDKAFVKSLVRQGDHSYMQHTKTLEGKQCDIPVLSELKKTISEP